MEPEFDLTPLVFAAVLLAPVVAGWIIDATTRARRVRGVRR